MAGKGKRINAEIKVAEVAVISESGESL